MADWQVGDLALCVSPGAGYKDIVKGGIHQVESVHPNVLWSQGYEYTGLRFVGVRHENWCGCVAWRFVKVTPPEADEFDREVIALLTGKPEQVTP